MELVKLNTKKNDCNARDIIRRNGFFIKKEMPGCIQVYHRDGKKYRFDGWETADNKMNPHERAKNPKYIEMRQI